MKETLQDIFQVIKKIQNDDLAIKDASKIFVKMKNIAEIAKIIKDECLKKGCPS